MPKQILACVKQVPGTTQAEVDPVTGILKRDGTESKLNPYDLYSLESALTFAESCGGRVTALTMGPRQAKAALWETVYMGAEAGILVSDRRFAGSDVLATAYTLSQAVKSIGEYDLIFCGKQTTDGDTAQVGAELAEFLGIPHAANVLSVEPDGDSHVIARLNGDDRILTQRLPLPCLLCIDGDINTPRLPSFKRKTALTGDPIREFTMDDFDDRDESHYGLSGSPTQVERIFPPEKNDEKELFTGSGEELGSKIAEILIKRKLV